MYKEPRAYKGFELIFHSLQMEFKMHFYTVATILLLHLSIPFFYLVLFKKDFLVLFFKVLLTFKLPLYVEAFKILVGYVSSVFLLSSIVWLLYPIILVFYKKKSSNLVKDKHIRGTKFISDEELRKIVLKDIKKIKKRGAGK